MHAASASCFESFLQEEFQKLVRKIGLEHHRLVSLSHASLDFVFQDELDLLCQRPRSMRLGGAAPAATGETPAAPSSQENDQHRQGSPSMPGATYDQLDVGRYDCQGSPNGPRYRRTSRGKACSRNASAEGGALAGQEAAYRINAVEHEVLRLHAELRSLHELLDSRLPAPCASVRGAACANDEPAAEPEGKGMSAFQGLRRKRMSKLGRKSVQHASIGVVSFDDEHLEEVHGAGSRQPSIDMGDSIMLRELNAPKPRSPLRKSNVLFCTPTEPHLSDRIRAEFGPYGEAEQTVDGSPKDFQAPLPVKRLSASSHCLSLLSEGTQQVDEGAHEPLVFELLPHWAAELGRDKVVRTASGFMSGDIFVSMVADDSPVAGWTWTLGPKSWPRLAWDTVSTFLVAYEFFTVPLGFLGFPETAFSISMDWITRLFWTLDIGASFVTGYTLDTGELTLRLRDIAYRYLRTWLLIDLVLVGMDWMQELNFQADSTGRIMRMLRIFRMMRLVRLARMMFVMQMTSERIRSEKAATLANIALIVALILGVTHVIACIWFALGNANADGWVKMAGYHDEERWLQYAISLHWSLTQLTGTMDLEPQNLPERLFAIATLLFAFVIASWFVSSITSSMTRLHIISRKQSVQFSMLRRFLFENGISQRLMTRLTRNARHALELRSRHLSECDVELLGIVAEPLRAELHFEIHWPKLEVHPLFSRYGRESPEAVRRLCHIAVITLAFERGDVLFDAGEVPLKRRMLFPWEGTLTYSLPKREDFSPSSSDRSETADLGYFSTGTTGPAPAEQPRRASGDAAEQTLVGPGKWLCEPVLWTRWTYVGNLQACSDCQLVAIDGSAFEEVAAITPSFDISRYAVLFIRALNECGSNRISDVGSHSSVMSLMLRTYGVKRTRTH